MSPEEISLACARLRTEVRAIEAQMRRIEGEDRLFRRYGFGSEVHEIQLTALRAERQERLADLRQLRARQRRRPTGRSGLGSWLLLPVALGAILFRSARRPRRPAGRVAHSWSTPLRPG
jgi:hypothetical protein